MAKRKKAVRLRGSKTHGYGSKKKHRGAGNKGGHGAAGSGKRGDAKKPSFWKGGVYFGKYGFKRKGIKSEVKAINISEIEERLADFISKKLVEEKNGAYIVDIKKIGFNKLLGSGRVTKKFNISADYVSKKAAEKIKKAGGVVLGKVE